MCPECESSEAHTLDTGRDAEGRWVRKRQCKDCGVEYTTTEVAVPISFHRIDVHGRDARRAERRRRDGFKGVQNRKPYAAAVVTIKVSIYDPSTRTRTP